jgi:hypothetical protein
MFIVWGLDGSGQSTCRVIEELSRKEISSFNKRADK